MKTAPTTGKRTKPSPKRVASPTNGRRARRKGHFVYGEVTKESQGFLDKMMTSAEYDELLRRYVVAVRAEAKEARKKKQTPRDRAALLTCDPAAAELQRFLSPNALADDILLAMNEDA